MNLGENIKKFRKAKKITQVQLANTINKSESTIQKYESNAVKPDFEALNCIADALNCNLSDLLGVETPANNLNYWGEYLKSIGYDIAFDEENTRLILHTKNGAYEISEKDETDLITSSKSFIEYKLHEIINKSKKI